jgi:hypothetical protein
VSFPLANQPEALSSFGASDARLWREYNEAERVYIIFKGKVCYKAL